MSAAREAIVRTLLVVALALAAVAPARAGVTVAITPASQSVVPGSDFDVSITVTQAGSAFNAFDAVVGFDPAALTPVPLVPLSSQQGTLITGACSNTFHQFEQGVGRDTITVVMLCNGVSVTGPGQIYRLRFHASNTPQVTTVRLLTGLQFYNAGLYVLPVTSSDATVAIGGATGVDDDRAPGARLRVSPNPARGAVSLSLRAPRVGAQEIVVLDLQGRRVRWMRQGVFDAGARIASWDGRADDGAPAAAGVYVIQLRVGGVTVAESRAVLLR